MIRVINQRIITGDVKYVELSCIHDDSKPTENICTGSLAFEADTGDVYAFDEESSTWNKVGE